MSDQLEERVAYLERLYREIVRKLAVIEAKLAAMTSVAGNQGQ